MEPRGAHLGGALGEWCVVAFGLGIALWFAVPWSVPLVALGAVALALSLALHFRSSALALALLFAVLGAGRAGHHAQSATTPVLSDRPLTYEVTGWVEDIERGPRGLRWIVRVSSMDARGGTPHRVRVNVGERDIEAGEGVTFRARLRALPPPAIPGGYDSARAAYFRGLGGSGAMLGEPVLVDVPTSGLAALKRAHTRWRYGVADRVRASAPERTAGMQASLLTGIRAWTPPEQTQALRDAGLAHIIAISGLHMGVFALTSYWLLSFLFCALPAGRSEDTRKWAAAVAILSATVYLALSGASVSAQRAFIMTTVWLLAVILERDPFSLRSVAVAALFTLAIHPESLLSAGFQMSFAAVTALIVVYGWWNARREHIPASPLRRAWQWWWGSAATSFIAGTATAGFAILHFGRVARWGLFANLAAMPVFTVVVMPAALASLLFMPLGLEAAPLWVMGQGLLAVLWIGEGVASWPGAVDTLPAAPAWALAVFAGGFVLLMLGRSRLRLAGGLAVASLTLTAFGSPLPTLRVSDQGVVTLWEVETGNAPASYSTSTRADNFGKSLWLERADLGNPTAHDLSARAACDRGGCTFVEGGRAVAVITHPADVADACATADLVILQSRSATSVARRHCEAHLIDAHSLRETGAVDVYLGDGVRIVGAKTKGRKAKPWR